MPTKGHSQDESHLLQNSKIRLLIVNQQAAKVSRHLARRQFDSKYHRFVGKRTLTTAPATTNKTTQPNKMVHKRILTSYDLRFLATLVALLSCLVIVENSQANSLNGRPSRNRLTGKSSSDYVDLISGGESLIDETSSLADSEHSNEDAQEAQERMFAISEQQQQQEHLSRLRALHRQNLFEKRQLGQPIQSSQELNPISIGLEPGAPFGHLAPFHEGPMAPKGPSMATAGDSLDGPLGPGLPFNLSPLPHLLGFQSSPFDGPQRGDQSAHSNQQAAVQPQVEPDGASAPAAVGSQKVWPKIFRFTDGRINLSDFEKQKKIRLSNKSQHSAGADNHIESAPIMFDGRQLKRKSFLILHGGIFS